MGRAGVMALAMAAALLAGAAGPAGLRAGEAGGIVDDFRDIAAWSAHPADGVDLRIGADRGAGGRAMRLDFDFGGGGGYAVAHRAVDLDLPDNYAFTFRVRGECLPNTLEFKLIDSTGENVWWSVRRNIEFPREWQTFRIKKRQISFAWGPTGGGEIRHVAAIEFSVTAASGGKGSVWIGDLEMTPLPPPDAVPPQPVVRASSSAPGHPAGLAVDGDSTTSWMPAPGDRRPWVELDLGPGREYGGLVVDWEPGRRAADYDVLVADEGAKWQPVRQVRGGGRNRDYLYLPESEARYVRLKPLGASPGVAPTIREITVKPLEWSATRETFFQAIAAEAPRGSYPRSFCGEQSYWTVVGVDGNNRQCLFNEDGAIEVGKSSFSVEPFIHTGGRLLTWADVQAEQWLEDGYLPIPSVRWTRHGLALTITAFGDGAADSSAVVMRYRLVNGGEARLQGTLFLATRPFQVNPPRQFLNTPGGTAPIHNLHLSGRGVGANWPRPGLKTAQVEWRPVISLLTPPTAFGAVTFDEGDVVNDWLLLGRCPLVPEVEDPFGAASAALSYDFDLAGGEEKEVDLLIPLSEPKTVSASSVSAAPAGPVVPVAARFEAARCAWKAKLDAAGFFQDAGRDLDLVATLKAQLGWILVSRDGPALQPGVRSYARSWIRDGALISSALLRTGQPEPVRAFIDWFAPHQYANGKIPCVADSRGADPVPEHDSTGEFIFLVAEYYRYQHDRAVVEKQWPRVLRAVAYLDSLRHERRTAEWSTPDKREFFGILPPSISHEGYSAKPMHSYWDDFWALKGFRDAAFLAGELGRPDDARRLAAIRDEFSRDLVNSIAAAMEKHRIDYIPGCADLGDFDATSTSIALDPVGADDILPRAALERTFEKYDQFVRERQVSDTWDVYTPYESRNIGAFVRLGRRENAQNLARFLMTGLRPAGWRVWAEVVGREPRASRFIGDMPHAWVGSDFVRSALDMFAYTHDADSTLVIGAGIPIRCLSAHRLMIVRGVRTPYGELSYSMDCGPEYYMCSSDVREYLTIKIEDGMRVPPGGIVVAVPDAFEGRPVSINNRPAKLKPGDRIIVRQVPAEVSIGPGEWERTPTR